MSWTTIQDSLFDILRVLTLKNRPHGTFRIILIHIFKSVHIMPILLDVNNFLIMCIRVIDIYLAARNIIVKNEARW